MQCIIWNLADGAQLKKLEGHTGDLNCLAALTGDRLASSSLGECIIIWNVADGTQLAKLEPTIQTKENSRFERRITAGKKYQLNTQGSTR